MEKLTGSLRSNWVYRVEENYEEVSSYAKKVYVNRKSTSSLSCKKVCISGLYEDYHFKEMMNIISLLAQNGAKYTKRAYACDIFVDYELVDKNGKEYKCYRKEKAENAIKSGNKIEIITFEKLLELLNTDGNAIKLLSEISSENIVYVEAYANKNNKISMKILQKSGFKIVGTNKTQTSFLYRATYSELAKRFKFN